MKISIHKNIVGVLISKHRELRGCLYTFTQNYETKKSFVRDPRFELLLFKRPLAVRMRTPETSRLEPLPIFAHHHPYHH